MIHMITKYTIHCDACKKAWDVDYGVVEEEHSIEVYACSKCHELFSLSNKKPMKCPHCGGKEAEKYNPHTKENMAFAEKMQKKGLLDKKEGAMLKKYWKQIESKGCPKCGKDTLRWEERT